MKRLLIALSLLGFGGTVFAATITQPMVSGISVLTLAQVAASTPTYVGQVVVCSNCTSANSGVGVLCLSTTTANAQNAYIVAGSSNTGATVTTCK